MPELSEKDEQELLDSLVSLLDKYGDQVVVTMLNICLAEREEAE